MRFLRGTGHSWQAVGTLLEFDHNGKLVGQQPCARAVRGMGRWADVIRGPDPMR